MSANGMTARAKLLGGHLAIDAVVVLGAFLAYRAELISLRVFWFAPAIFLSATAGTALWMLFGPRESD
ncbi:hypothetical protein [Kineosporia succinea]|uniref:Uncharacterized protein n=1 Tax=Kineosporia succinea TaxID=84632 RepID=A0ABT9PDU1_9ACTN|nr:hypothetical protein [Kineosporia succinea]MDP9830876.1 hypothetical protein [Kineosporia succinea]